jgi:ketosteroid isomerase-like protein
MTVNDSPRDVALAFVRAFGSADLDALGALLADDFVGHVTTADGGVVEVDREGYVDSVRSMDVATANLRLEVPNIVEVGMDRVLVMVVVHAARGGKTLHNFSGQLATVASGRLTELWMVDALPAESDEFWS